MNKDQFSNLLLVRDYEKVEKTLVEGFDPNTPLENDKPAIEWCAYSNDYKMMELLWKYGAKPTIPFTEEVINAFEKGETYDFFMKSDDFNQEDLKDLTKNFMVVELEFLSGSISHDNDIYRIDIPISKFFLDDEVIETSIILDQIQLPDSIDKLIGKELTFAINPVEGYIDGSIYLRNVHNPVDVSKLVIKDLKNKMLDVELHLHFVFDYEGIGFKNEHLVLQVKLANNL